MSRLIIPNQPETIPLQWGVGHNGSTVILQLLTGPLASVISVDADSAERLAEDIAKTVALMREERARLALHVAGNGAT